MTLETAVELAFAGPPPTADELRAAFRVRKMAIWIPITEALLEDGPAIRATLNAMIRAGRLAALGFRGLVRCDRCRRSVRCVYAVTGQRIWGLPVANRYYGRTCYAKAVG